VDEEIPEPPSRRRFGLVGAGLTASVLVIVSAFVAVSLTPGHPSTAQRDRAASESLIPGTLAPIATSAVLLSPLFAQESVAWRQLSRAAPLELAVTYPTVLPSSIDRHGVHIAFAGTGSTFRYVVEYDGQLSPRALAFGVGDPPGVPAPVEAADLGSVRNSGAELVVGNGGSGPRQVVWAESGVTHWIYSSVLTGNELAIIAWHVTADIAAPPLPFTYQRTASGACTSAGLVPEALAQRFTALIGQHRREVLYDCFSLDFIARQSRRGDSYADADPVTAAALTVLPYRFGDRVLVRATIAFAVPQADVESDIQLVIGTEDGVPRVFGIRSGDAPPLP
jgi:hypothetical protein